MLNFAMWKKALRVIPNISKEEWMNLDVISKWLISSRAAVLVMTFISTGFAGVFAWRDGEFHFFKWLALTIGLILAHASNNLFNDYVDFARGVDQKNYFRTLYGPHPLENKLMTRTQHLTYFAMTGLGALLCGLYLIWQSGNDMLIWRLLLIGSFFLLFYTWPLKYIAMGEIAVLVVWGPLMVGGGYYTITHQWSWNVVLASIIYALGVTTVIFGKHIDKIDSDKAKHIYTLPVLIGERFARYTIIGMIVLAYILIVYLVIIKYFTPVVLIVFFALPSVRNTIPLFLNPKPVERPTNFPNGQGGWPLYFAPIAFQYNRSFGTIFIFAVIADTLIHLLLPAFWK